MTRAVACAEMKPCGVSERWLHGTDELEKSSLVQQFLNIYYGEFDSGSERTLAAWIRHASRTKWLRSLSGARVSNT